nr:Beta-ketoacyl synthase [uncultured bacterium]
MSFKMSNIDLSDIPEEIAVIGMAGRFPKARNIREFWRNLRDGVEGISFFSDEELLAAGIKPSTLANPNYVKARMMLDDVEMFDASFFGFTPREAETTDPQHRLFLECAWEALEDAGYDPARYPGLIGVYAGVSMNTYLFNLYSNRAVIEATGGFQVAIGNDKDHLPTSVSYKLDLRGPSVAVQTACSTSLVAVHLACQALLNGECDMALAGGASVVVPQRAGYFYEEGGIDSPDGHCRPFDSQAQGTTGGSRRRHRPAQATLRRAL